MYGGRALYNLNRLLTLLKQKELNLKTFSEGVIKMNIQAKALKKFQRKIGREFVNV